MPYTYASLNYLGYKQAALQHLHTCKVLIRYAKLPDGSNLKRINEQEILQNIYYLSGYIIECSLYSAYFARYASITDVNTITDTSQHYRYRGHFRFTTNWTFCKKVLQDIPDSRRLPNYWKHLGTIHGRTPMSPAEQRLKILTEKWDPAVRYQYGATGLAYNRQEILDYYDSAVNLCRILRLIP